MFDRGEKRYERQHMREKYGKNVRNVFAWYKRKIRVGLLIFLRINDFIGP